MQQAINLDDVEHVDWPGTTFFPALRLDTGEEAIRVPLTIEGYSDLYQLLVNRIPGRVFALDGLPVSIRKPTVNRSLLVMPAMTAIGVAGLVAIPVFFIDGPVERWAIVALLAAVYWSLASSFAKSLNAFWSGIPDLTALRDDGIYESSLGGAGSVYTPSSDVVDVSLCEGYLDPGRRRLTAESTIHAFTHKLRVRLKNGREIEIPSLHLGFRADKLSHQISKAYGVPLKTYMLPKPGETQRGLDVAKDGQHQGSSVPLE